MRECETWFEKVFLKYLEDQKIPRALTSVSRSWSRPRRTTSALSFSLPTRPTSLLPKPLDVTIFAPLKKQWRKELDNYKEYCVHNNIRSTTTPKDKFASLLKATLDNNTVYNASNVQAGFAACGIIPSSPDRVLAWLPPEETAKQGV
jgi:hypothetical protein